MTTGLTVCVYIEQRADERGEAGLEGGGGPVQKQGGNWLSTVSKCGCKDCRTENFSSNTDTCETKKKVQPGVVMWS